jgi:hypothetical protein
MAAKNLVQSWLEFELEVNQKTLTEALYTLNSKMNSAHTHSRVNEWKETRNGRGERLPRDLRVHLAKLVIGHVLESSGVEVRNISKRVLNKIAEQLC